MSSSTSSSTSSTQGEMAVDRHETARTEQKAWLLKELDISTFIYHEKRRTGRISQNEAPRWGYEDPRQRQETRIRHDTTHIAQCFHEIDWNKGFKGRGVDARYDQTYGDYRLEGPKGEIMKDIVGAEAPTSPKARRLWRLLDKHKDNGIDLFYRGPPIDWDEETCWSDDKGAGSLSETEVDDEVGPVNKGGQHSGLDTSGEMRDTLRNIAAQAFHVLDDEEDDVGSLNETKQEAELDPSGEMRDVLMQIADERFQTLHQEPVIAKDSTSLELSRESTKHYRKKRRWSSVDGPGYDAPGDWSGDGGYEPYRGSKRLRTWQAGEADALGGVKDIPGYISNEDSECKASQLRQKSLRILQASKRTTSGEVDNILQSFSSRGSMLISASCVAAEARSSGGDDSRLSPLPKIGKKREGDPMHNDLVDTIIEVQENMMNTAKRKAQRSQQSNDTSGEARDRVREDYHSKGFPGKTVQNPRATKQAKSRQSRVFKHLHRKESAQEESPFPSIPEE